jgi:hypothetical protein
MLFTHHVNDKLMFNNEIKDQIARLQMLISPFHFCSEVKSGNVFVGCPTAALHDDIKAITQRLWEVI